MVHGWQLTLGKTRTTQAQLSWCLCLSWAIKDKFSEKIKMIYEQWIRWRLKKYIKNVKIRRKLRFKVLSMWNIYNFGNTKLRFQVKRAQQAYLFMYMICYRDVSHQYIKQSLTCEYCIPQMIHLILAVDNFKSSLSIRAFGWFQIVYGQYQSETFVLRILISEWPLKKVRL